MDSELDKKLKKLVMRHGWITENDDWQQAVTDIKDAFIEYGWITPEQVEKTQELVNQMANLANDMARRPVILRETELAQPLNDRGFYTGEEWLDNFAKELSKLEGGTGYDLLLLTQAVIPAAKRAAGITEADNE